MEMLKVPWVVTLAAVYLLTADHQVSHCPAQDFIANL